MKRTVIQVGWDERDTLSQGARERHVTAKQHTHTHTQKKKQKKNKKKQINDTLFLSDFIRIFFENFE